MRYNWLQYSLRVWLTSVLAIPHLYLLFYALSEGLGLLPFTSYLELLLLTFVLSLPIGIVFMIAIDKICLMRLPLNLKKFLAWFIAELLLLALFAVIVNGFGNINWESCVDLLMICSFTIGISIYLYKLKPLTAKQQKLV